MADNNQANDRYNPPSTTSADFERYTFEELEIDELFWQTNQPGDSYSWRKINKTQAMNLRKRSTHNFSNKTVVYQKV